MIKSPLIDQDLDQRIQGTGLHENKAKVTNKLACLILKIPQEKEVNCERGGASKRGQGLG